MLWSELKAAIQFSAFLGNVSFSGLNRSVHSSVAADRCERIEPGLGEQSEQGACIAVNLFKFPCNFYFVQVSSE